MNKLLELFFLFLIIVFTISFILGEWFILADKIAIAAAFGLLIIMAIDFLIHQKKIRKTC